MASFDSIQAAVLEAVDQLNEQLPVDQQLERSPSTALSGPDGVLDSLGIVNLIVLVEETIERRFGASVNLLEDDFGDGIALTSVGAMAEFVARLLEEREHA